MQNQYTQNMAVALPGMIADTCRVQDIVTHYNPDGPVGFGTLVTRGDESDTIVPLADAGGAGPAKLRGVVVRTHEQVSVYPGGQAAVPEQYPAQSVVPVMKKGRIWALVEDQVTESVSTAFVRVGGTGVKGALRASDDGSNAEPVAGIKFLTSTQGPNQLALLEIDL